MYNTCMMAKKKAMKVRKWVELGLRVTPEEQKLIAQAIKSENNLHHPRVISQNSFCVAAVLAAAEKVMKVLD